MHHCYSTLFTKNTCFNEVVVEVCVCVCVGGGGGGGGGGCEIITLEAIGYECTIATA